jgi:hypothetical protein
MNFRHDSFQILRMLKNVIRIDIMDGIVLEREPSFEICDDIGTHVKANIHPPNAAFSILPAAKVNGRLTGFSADHLPSHATFVLEESLANNP